MQSKIFFVWFGCCFLCIAFVYFMVYETKGLSLEQVDELYADKSVSPWRSAGWRPSSAGFQEKGGEMGDKEGASTAEVVALEEVGA